MVLVFNFWPLTDWQNRAGFPRRKTKLLLLIQFHFVLLDILSSFPDSFSRYIDSDQSSGKLFDTFHLFLFLFFERAVSVYASFATFTDWLESDELDVEPHTHTIAMSRRNLGDFLVGFAESFKLEKFEWKEQQQQQPSPPRSIGAPSSTRSCLYYYRDISVLLLPLLCRWMFSKRASKLYRPCPGLAAVVSFFGLLVGCWVTFLIRSDGWRAVCLFAGGERKKSKKISRRRRD